MIKRDRPADVAPNGADVTGPADVTAVYCTWTAVYCTWAGPAGGGGSPGRAPSRTVNVCPRTVNGCDVIGERLTWRRTGADVAGPFLPRGRPTRVV
jgi:hypothetical protein